MAAVAMSGLLGLVGLRSAAVWRRGPRFPHYVECRKKSTKYLTRSNQPKLAYRKIKGRSPGIIFLPGFASTMQAHKAVAVEDFCKSIGHSFVRGRNLIGGIQIWSSGKDGHGFWTQRPFKDFGEEESWKLAFMCKNGEILVGSSMGGWLMLLAALARPNKIAALVGIATGADYLVTAFKQLPLETKKEIEAKGEWYLPNKHKNAEFHKIPYTFIKDAENHCVLHSTIPITCPVRLIHGWKDNLIPWQISLNVAENVLSSDVDLILRKQGQHRMNEKDDVKLILNTIDDLIDKLTTLA
ncbi:abhydrolase domain containing 10, depalmitoylase a isoform X1 [Heterodontus francisci]|uniref:abhydrolase domain containing 10, depalmitoylase a isoform X1 n=1 Tax=Heterodontus francisci TaxID=7792 RepID=UPI00355C86E3